MSEQHLADQIAALRAEVRRLSDIIEIGQLVSQYGPNVDSGAADEAARLWTKDGTFSVVGGEKTFVMEGRQGVVGMVQGPGHQDLIHNGCAHVLSTPHIVVDGDVATGRSYALNIRWDGAAERFWVARVSANGWKFVRTDQGWRIAERVNSNLQGDEASRALLLPVESKGRNENYAVKD